MTERRKRRERACTTFDDAEVIGAIVGFLAGFLRAPTIVEAGLWEMIAEAMEGTVCLWKPGGDDER